MRKIITIFILIFLFSTNAFAITLYDSATYFTTNTLELFSESETQTPSMDLSNSN